MKKLILCLSVLCTLTVSAQQVAKSTVASNGRTVGFYQFTPTDYASSGKTYPLIIFLHGLGERGNGTTELSKVLANGVPKNIQNGSKMTYTWNGKTETFLVLSPQLAITDTWEPWYVQTMIDYAKKNLRIDQNRIILTGLSLGGGGTWKFPGTSLSNAQQLAAIGVSCGTCEYLDFCNIAKANLPTWAFHAQDDPTVGVACTISQVGYINQCNPAVEPYMTIFPSGGHGIWGRMYDEGYTYQNPNLYEWFIAQDKSKPANKRPIAKAGNPLSILATLGIVTLDGSQSSDPDGKIVRYIWRKISGPSAGAISASISLNGVTTVTGLNSAGIYQYELKVADDRADVSMDTVTVTVGTTTTPPPAQSPTANAGADQTITQPASSVTLTGSATTPNGSISSYTWTKVSGGNATITSAGSASTTVTGLAAGSYAFRLTVKDNTGATSSDDVTINVNQKVNRAPTSNAGPDATITLPISQVDLQGSGSDPDGDAFTYLWTRVSGPSQYAYSNPSSSKVTFWNLVEGTYVFKLEVKDANNALATDEVTVIVKPAGSGTTNKAPTASAGNDQTITLPSSSVSLSGSGTDADGTIASYSWSKVSGPTAGNIANAGSASSSVTGLTEGTYVFRLTVKDNNGASATNDVTITVKAAATTPDKLTVNAGADQTINLPTTQVDVVATGTGIASYLWSKVSGPSFAYTNPYASKVTFWQLSEGTYVFRITVKDNSGASASDDVTVIVKGSNKAPTANAGAAQTITLPASSVTLRGSGADTDGSVASYAWSKVSGGNATVTSAGAATTTVTGLALGTYVFRLTVKDDDGASATSDVTITVKGASKPDDSNNGGGTGSEVAANAGADQSIVLPANSVILNGGGTVPGGYITSYFWAKISGPNAAYTSPYASSITFWDMDAGTYVFRLTISTNGGELASDDVTVTVGSTSSGSAPTAYAGANQTITMPVNSVTFTGSGTAASGGYITSYLWSKVSGPASLAYTNPTSSTITFWQLEAGTYVFRLMVKDNNDKTASSDVTVVVQGSSISSSKVVATATSSQKATTDATIADADKLLIYPNPVQSQFNLQTTSAAIGASYVNIYDASGKLVRKTAFQKTQVLHQQYVAADGLMPGLYQVQVVIDGKKTLNSKFVKL
jgi:poly(3-hydroxybutyrate) depolymerase